MDERIAELLRELEADGIDPVEIAAKLLSKTGAALSRTYRIQRKKDGWWSKGGSRPKFSQKTGKLWHRRGDLSSHLAGLMASSRVEYEGCEVVEYVMLAAGDGLRVPVADFKTIKEEKRLAAEQKAAAKPSLTAT